MQKLLFVCSRNRIRSLTAERLFDGHPRYLARSAGTAEGARVRVTAGQLGWADIIFVMEKRHRDLLRARFAAAIAGKPIICLGVPDDFSYMAPDLIDLLTTLLADHLPAMNDEPRR